jgi:hypothetical protein
MKTRFLFLIVIVALVLMPFATSAQGMPPVPATPVPGDAPTGILAEFNFRHLASPHAEAWFVRIGLEPGGSMPLQNEHGQIILYVESGELEMDIEGPVVLPGADRGQDLGEHTMLPGDSLQMTPVASAILTNEGANPVTFLAFIMYPAETEGEGEESMAEPIGMSQMAISIGSAEFDARPATVRIERVVLESGATADTPMGPTEIEMPGYMGMELGAVETGAADVEVTAASMAHLAWPGMMMDPMVQPELVPLTANVHLEPGDAYAFHGSVQTWTSTGDEPLTVLRVVIVPAPNPMP